MNAHIKKMSPHYGVMARQRCCLHTTQARLDWSINVSCMMSNWLKTRCLAHFNVPNKPINKNKEAFKKLIFQLYNLCKHCNCPKIIKYALEKNCAVWVVSTKMKIQFKPRLNFSFNLNSIVESQMNCIRRGYFIMIFRGIKRLI